MNKHEYLSVSVFQLFSLSKRGSLACHQPLWRVIFRSMNTLLEIEAAADQLPAEEQQELLLFLATRLHRASGALPPPRDLPLEKIEGWIADDEAGHRRFLAGA